MDGFYESDEDQDSLILGSLQNIS